MENLIIPKEKLPWYKDADATRIAVGVGYLVMLCAITGAPVYYKRVNGEFVVMD